MPRRNPPPPPPKRPPTRKQLTGSLARVRKFEREHTAREKPFDPTRAPSWRGSSRDLVVNRRHRPNAHQTGFGFGEALELQMPTFGWRQIGGDMDPGSHGGLIARADGDQIELIEIQPVREYVGDGEAKDVGFPFWTREATYDLNDIKKAFENRSDKGWAPLDYVGLTAHELQEMDPQQRVVATAEAMMRYGEGVEEGAGGFARGTDSRGGLLNFPIEWWGGTIATFPEYCGDEDDEFRKDVLGEEWHYVYGSGMKGYLFDNGPHVAETLEDAIDGLVQTFTGGDPEISEDEEKRMRKALLEDGYYEFDNPREIGAEYCEITEEDGPMPEEDE